MNKYGMDRQFYMVLMSCGARCHVQLIVLAIVEQKEWKVLHFIINCITVSSISTSHVAVFKLCSHCKYLAESLPPGGKTFLKMGITLFSC